MNADTRKDNAYFKLYEERYRRIYEQGFNYWISDPNELMRTIESVDAFLNYAECSPQETRVIEFGCGEGHLARHFLARGFKYLGVDISESAIRKARELAGADKQELFVTGDVTDLNRIPDKSYDITIDNLCLQMLITDNHRKNYLTEVRRVLKDDGWAYFRENKHENEFTAKIGSLEEFIESQNEDNSSEEEYPAYANGKQQTIKLQRIPARFNNQAGYRKELESAGLRMDCYSIEGNYCTFYVRAR
jgi:SAM-dependent methyltransferase